MTDTSCGDTVTVTNIMHNVIQNLTSNLEIIQTEGGEPVVLGDPSCVCHVGWSVGCGGGSVGNCSSVPGISEVLMD